MKVQIKYPVWFTFLTVSSAMRFERFCQKTPEMQSIKGMRDRNKVELQFDKKQDADWLRRRWLGMLKDPTFKNRHGIVRID